MHYELFYIIPFKYPENELPEILKKITNTIKKAGATTTKQESWDKRKIAYPIKQNRHAYFITTEIDTDPKNLQKLNQELQESPKILRHQITHFKPGSTEPSREIEITNTKPEEVTVPKSQRDPLGTKKTSERARPAEGAAGLPNPPEGRGTVTPTKETKTKTPTDKKTKVALEDLDKKLDEILSDTDLNT